MSAWRVLNKSHALHSDGLGPCDSLFPVVGSTLRGGGARRAGVQSRVLELTRYRAGANGHDSLRDSLLLFFELLTQSSLYGAVPSGTLAAICSTRGEVVECDSRWETLASLETEAR